MNVLRDDSSKFTEAINKYKVVDLFASRADKENVQKNSPHIEVISEPNRYVIYADLPEVDPKQMRVILDGDILTIEGARSKTYDSYYPEQHYVGDFYRQFIIPGDVAIDHIVANFEKGVLKVMLPKL